MLVVEPVADPVGQRLPVGLVLEDALARARALNSSTPNVSMSFLPLSLSSFSTSISTGRPWVSQPAIRVTSCPCIAW